MCIRNVSYSKIKGEGRKRGKKGEPRGGREGRRMWEVGGGEGGERGLKGVETQREIMLW